MDGVKGGVDMTEHIIEIAADAPSVRRLAAWIHRVLELHLDAEVVELLAPKVDLAVREVCTNIVEHAYADRVDGRISVTLDVATTEVVVTTSDNGVAFTPDAPDAADASDASDASGHGLFIVHRLTTTFAIERIGTRNRATLRFDLAPTDKDVL